MALSLSDSEIEEAFRLCANLPGSSGSEASQQSLAEVEARAVGPRRDFLNFLTSLGEPKLSELCALMYYGRDEDGSFETFQQALTECEALGLEAKTGVILEKSVRFQDYVRKGLARVK
jgi:hypothetical protein